MNTVDLCTPKQYVRLDVCTRMMFVLKTTRSTITEQAGQKRQEKVTHSDGAGRCSGHFAVVLHLLAGQLGCLLLQGLPQLRQRVIPICNTSEDQARQMTS